MRVLEMSIEGNVMNSLEPPFYNRAKMFGLPMSVEPGTYDFHGTTVEIKDISERADIIEFQKAQMTKSAEAVSINKIGENYSITDIILITALKEDLPELYEEMRVHLLAEFQDLYAAKSRIENAITATQLTRAE